MTAKEKAKELIDKFEKETEHQDSHWDTFEVSKQCALICVDEKITSLEQIKHPANTKRTNRRIDRYIYELEQIKQELEKL